MCEIPSWKETHQPMQIKSFLLLQFCSHFTLRGEGRGCPLKRSKTQQETKPNWSSFDSFYLASKETSTAKKYCKIKQIGSIQRFSFPMFLLWNFYLFIYFQFKVLIETKKKKDGKKERKEEKGIRKGKRLEKRISNILYVIQLFYLKFFI